MADLGILCQLDERRAPSDRDNENDNDVDKDKEKDESKNPTVINQNSAVGGISTRRKSETQRPETSLRNQSQNQNDRGMDTAQMSDEESLSPVTPCFSADSPMPHTKTFVGYVRTIRVQLSHLIYSLLFLTIVIYQFTYASIYPSISSFRKAYLPISVSVALSLSFSLSQNLSLYLYVILYLIVCIWIITLSFSTVTFMSPERIDGREYSYPSDVWAFGLSLMTLAKGSLPIDTQGASCTYILRI